MCIAKKIFYYDHDGDEVCIFYLSMARLNILRISHGSDFDILPNNWQYHIKDILVAQGVKATVTDGDILCPSNSISNDLLIQVFKIVSIVMFGHIVTSSFVFKSVSNVDDDIAYVYFMDIETRSVGIEADLRDLNVVGVDTSNCVNGSTIIITKTAAEKFEDIIQKVCETINEYLPQILF